ncbi:MAG: hypothetical protein HC869_16925 [Rhodospirillales bacterium]|nr:hypothetical protein [Rhodospirillales bacterium]
MAWELHPAIAGTAVAGLFLGVILATSTAHASTRPVKGSASTREGLRVGSPIGANWIRRTSSRDSEFAASLLSDADRA